MIDRARLRLLGAWLEWKEIRVKKRVSARYGRSRDTRGGGGGGGGGAGRSRRASSGRDPLGMQRRLELIDRGAQANLSAWRRRA